MKKGLIIVSIMSLLCFATESIASCMYFQDVDENSQLEPSTESQSITEDSKKPQVFVSWREKPALIGGEEAIIKYIKENDLYPKEALKDSIDGSVTVIFIIDSMGVVVNPEVEQEVPDGFGFGEAAIMVITAMKYEPAFMNEKSVPVLMKETIRFNHSLFTETPGDSL